MASKEQFDRYAAELVARFEDLTHWAVANWPRDDFPLMQSDFKDARREISLIIGPKLGDADTPEPHEPRRKPDDRQYVDMNPAPWP
jgi:hypothetical protein